MTITAAYRSGLAAVHYAFAAVVTSTAIVGLLSDRASVDGNMPAWFDVVIVSAIGAYTLFASRYWRIRPIHPQAMGTYARTVAIRTGLALGPAAAGIVLRSAGGHRIGLFVALAISAWTLILVRPTNADWLRHVDLWTEVGAMPDESLWGTADPDAVPPWEDPDGGHGHELFHKH